MWKLQLHNQTPMKNKQLIAELKKLPLDAEVCGYCDELDIFYTIDTVKLARETISTLVLDMAGNDKRFPTRLRHVATDKILLDGGD